MPEIPKIPSSNIKAAGYSAKSKTFRVSFKAGATYDYIGVPPEVFSNFMASDSKGRFFFANIKAKFESVKVNIPVAK